MIRRRSRSWLAIAPQTGDRGIGSYLSSAWGAIFLIAWLAAPGGALAQHDYKTSRTLIRDGKYAEAVEYLDGQVRRQPDDSEWVAQRALAHLLARNFEAGLADIEQSLKMGVAAGRFVAESRNILQPVAQEPAFRAWLKRQHLGVIHGPMLGDVTTNSALIWIRTAAPARVRVLSASAGVANDKGGAQREDDEEPQAPRIVAIGQTTDESDLSLVLRVAGLEPDTKYVFAVESEQDDRWLPGGKVAFRTAPVAGRTGRFSIAFGGGAGYVPENERMWDVIADRDPRALLLLGDNVYIDMPEHPEMQRFCYYRRHSVPNFRALIAGRPAYSIWDDHDFGTNDCWGGPEIETPAWKRSVWNIFRQNWVNPGYGGGEEQPGCWYDFHIGDVHFVMLDGRYYRTDPRPRSRANSAAPPSMLGPVQLAWLKDVLRGSQAKFIVLVSPVPWVYESKGDSLDTWNGYRDEREEIFGFLTERRIGGVLLMSADRHRSDAWKIERPGDYPLYEFESSRLTNRHVHPTMPEALFSYNKKQSFGLVTFDLTEPDPSVTYEAISIDDEIVESLRLRRSELEPRKD